MTKKYFLSFSLIMIAGIIICFIMYWRITYVQKQFSCEARLTLMDHTSSYEILMNFAFANESGTYEASGLYKDQHGHEIKTSNKVTFDYWRKGENLYLISKETNELPKTEIPLIDWKPDFFRKRNRGIAFQLIQKNTDGYVFLYDHTPLFYCTRNNGQTLRN